MRVMGRNGGRMQKGEESTLGEQEKMKEMHPGHLDGVGDHRGPEAAICARLPWPPSCPAPLTSYTPRGVSPIPLGRGRAGAWGDTHQEYTKKRKKGTERASCSSVQSRRP